MNRKQFLISLVLVAVFGGAGLLIYTNQKGAWTAGASAGGKLLGDLPVNDVGMITIRHGTNEVNLARKEDLWRVRERADYPADFSQVSGLLLKARELKAVQVEKVGPSQLPRLQLATAEQGSNAAVVVQFKSESEKPLQTLLLGKLHRRASSRPSPFGDDEAFPDGRYVMLESADSVALINDPLENIAPEPANWLDKEFFRVEKPKSIEVTFSESKNSWKLIREAESADWTLADAAEGEQLDMVQIGSVTHPFSSPNFTDVLPGLSLDETGTNLSAGVKIETFEGFNYLVKIGQRRDGDYPLAVSVAGTFSDDDSEKLREKLKREQRLEKWTYLVPVWTVDSLLKERKQLLKTAEPESVDSDPAEASAAGEEP